MNHSPVPIHTPHRWRVLLVDDHALVRAGYSQLLSLEPDITVVAEAGDADSAQALLQARHGDFDVLVLDLSLPGRSGLDVLRRVRMRWPQLPVLVCSMHTAPALVAQALAAGARGFVTKRSDPGLLAQAIRSVATGQTLLSPDIIPAVNMPAATAPHQALSAREFEVLLGLVRGASVDALAQALHLAPKTVANLQTQVRSKLGVGNAVELLRYARQHHLDAG